MNNKRQEVKEIVLEALSSNEIVIDADKVEVNRTQDLKFGDYATNIALKLAKETNRSPQEIAKVLSDNINNHAQVDRVEVAGPGFINIFLKDEVWQSVVENVLKENDKFGANEVGKDKKARVEFVSANPTGPLHFGNARGGPIGDALARVLEFSGYKVLREYIHNDIGGQVTKLGQTIVNVSKGEKLENQEYKGEYIGEIVEKIGEFSTAQEAGKMACDMMLDEILADCEAMAIKFDDVFPESGFVESGKTKEALEQLQNDGVLREKDGATWFAPNDEFLKDRETVVIKSDGSYTYFANDIAYHRLKFLEDYDLVVDVFGANHHGHVPRLKAVIQALGGDVSKFHVILYQWVRFKKDGELIAMSKRSGNFVTAKEILDMVGSDAVRFYILMHDANSHIDFDLDLAREKSNKNPVFYVQYAHARIASIMAKEEARISQGKVDFSLLSGKYELELIKKVAQLPELVEDISTSFAVNRLTTYSMELADIFHKFYENVKVLNSEDENLTRARLALVDATRIALRNCLNLLGVSSPDQM